MNERAPGHPRRVLGANLPAAAYLAADAARAPMPNVLDARWYVHEQSVRLLLNGLRRWRRES